MTATARNTIQELHRLAILIDRYRHRWGSHPSDRMVGWVDSYEALRHELHETQQGRAYWAAYCDKMGFDASHNAYDLLA